MSLKEQTILSQYGKSNTGFLHANGWDSTKFLMQELDCQANECVLEIGHGTGATLVELASRYRCTNFYGVEVNKLMHRKGIQRIKLCGLSKNIDCTLSLHNSKLSFSDNSFDKVYCESVLGILEGNDLPNLLTEIRRVLKPDGILLFNETIWTSNVSSKIILEINSFCKSNYGIIQSTADYPYLADWEKLLRTKGFFVLDKHELHNIGSVVRIAQARQSIVSILFSIWGKIWHGAGLSKLNDIQNKLTVPNNVMRGIIIKSKATNLSEGE